MSQDFQKINSKETSKELRSLISRAKDDFYIFARIMAPEVIPEKFVPGKHIKIICKELQAVYQSVIDENPIRVQFWLPPGSMKSKLCNILFPAWVLGKSSYFNILSVGHSTNFVAKEFGIEVRDLIKTTRYKSVFPELSLREDVRASKEWHTTNKGKWRAAGVASKIAGKRAHISICDDVISEQEGFNTTAKKKINDWYVPGLRSRLLPHGAEIIINTRWALDDLSGYTIELDKNSSQPWKIVAFPAILDEKAAKMLGSKPGESYWPEYWTLEKLKDKKKTTLPYMWNSLYMQDPVPEEGGVIKEKWIKKYTKKKPPHIQYIVASADTALADNETSAYNAITVWGIFFTEEMSSYDYDKNGRVIAKKKLIKIPNLILLDSIKGRWDFPQIMENLEKVNDDYSPDLFIIEKKASGPMLLTELYKNGINSIGFDPKDYGDKTTRMYLASQSFFRGRIHIPFNEPKVDEEGEFVRDHEDDIVLQYPAWAEEVKDDLVNYPAISSFDLSDTVSQVILWLRSNNKLKDLHDAIYSPSDFQHDYDEEEEEFMYAATKKTRWGSVKGSKRIH